MTRGRQQAINLALQGGGSHGAFTWGVLDRLLEEENLVFEGVSGTSAGAMNAVLLAHGLTIGGRAGARQVLAEFWGQVAHQFPLSLLDSSPSDEADIMQNGGSPSPMFELFLALSRYLSPYELNPFDLNPLRGIVNQLVDFERLRAGCPLKLFVAATHVRTGKLRLFGTSELTADILLASACLPSLHHAIEINGEAYWDGGYAANPAIYPLFYHCRSRDIVLVLLHPLARPETPKSAAEIWNRVAELSFSVTLLRELRTIIDAREMAKQTLLPLGRLERRLRRVNFHMIEADELMTQLSTHSRLNINHDFLLLLRDQGRARAEYWLVHHQGDLGRRSSVDLAEVFG